MIVIIADGQRIRAISSCVWIFDIFNLCTTSVALSGFDSIDEKKTLNCCVRRSRAIATDCVYIYFVFVMNSVIDSFTMSAANKKDESTKSPLILDGHQWQNIVKQLRPEDETLARREKEREYEKYLKNGSRSMTKHWTNSVEKIRERENLELMRAREKKRADGK